MSMSGISPPGAEPRVKPFNSAIILASSSFCWSCRSAASLIRATFIAVTSSCFDLKDSSLLSLYACPESPTSFFANALAREPNRLNVDLDVSVSAADLVLTLGLSLGCTLGNCLDAACCWVDSDIILIFPIQASYLFHASGPSRNTKNGAERKVYHASVRQS